MTTKIQTENGRDYITLPGGWSAERQVGSMRLITPLCDSARINDWFIAKIMEDMARAINAEWNRLLDRIAELEAMEASLLEKVSKFSEEGAAAKVENQSLRLELGQLRMCVNCGRTKPASEPRHDTPDGCDGIACTFDLTPQEAADHWRGLACRMRDAVKRAPSLESATSMGADGSKPVEDERLAFEAWMRGHCWTVAA